MKKAMLTGATGFIGNAIACRLHNEGHSIHALVRSPEKAYSLPAETRRFSGDIHSVPDLERAMEGVEEVYHIAAFARPWAKDKQDFYRINTEGASNVFEAARRQGVRRVVFTSTAGVFGPSYGGAPAHEGMEVRNAYFTDYERSKVEAEALAQERVRAGQDIVIVNPSRVYGPGELSVSNSVTKMIKLYLEGRFRLLPGDGHSIGNYVYIDDVVNGHLLAMDRGVSGERYALGGENASYRQFFHHLRQVTGVHKTLYPMPIALMKGVSYMMKARADLLGTPPMITPEWVRRFLAHWELSTEKAERELGYQPTGLEEGIRRTVEWLRS